MEGIAPSVEDALVHWFNTFPDLPRVINSFDDLYDGLIFCLVLNQIDPGFSFISVQNENSITTEESLSLYDSIQAYLKSDIVDEEAAASEEQVLNIESIFYDHSKEEVLYLTKILLGLAMQCFERNTIITRITQLPKEIQDILMLITQEVLSSMQVPEEEEEEEIDDEHLKTFDEMMQEVGDEEDLDDWNEWNDTETPLNSTSPFDHSEKLLEEKDNEIDSLKQEILRLTEENKDYQQELEKLQKEKLQLLDQQEKLSASLSESNQQILKLQMENATQMKEYDESVTQSTETMKTELERLENENAILIAENKTLTEKVTVLKNEYTNEIDASTKQIAVLKEELAQLSHVEATNQSLSKQLAEYKKESQNTPTVVNESPASSDYQKRLLQALEDYKALQGRFMETNHLYELAKEEVSNLRQLNEEYKNDIAILNQKNDSLQLLLSPSEEDKRMNEEKGVSFQELLGGKSEEESGWREKYTDEAEKLVKAKETIMSLQKNVNDLQIVNVNLQQELLKIKHGDGKEEEEEIVINEEEPVSTDQVKLLMRKLQIKEEKLECLKRELDVAQGEINYKKQQYESVQNDNQELTNNLKKEFDEIKKLEEKNKKLAMNFRQSLNKLKQCDVYMKEYEKQIEEEKNRSIQQDKYVKKQEEVMFATIHKMGQSSLMKYYKSHLDLYHPQGWLARVRMSQSKLF